MTIQIEHDHSRARLDLYCSLVVVFLVSGLVGIVALSDERSLAAVSGCVAVGLAWLSYRAAIASAHGYGVILLTITEITRPR